MLRKIANEAAKEILKRSDQIMKGIDPPEETLPYGTV